MGKKNQIYEFTIILAQLGDFEVVAELLAEHFNDSLFTQQHNQWRLYVDREASTITDAICSALRKLEVLNIKYEKITIN